MGFGGEHVIITKKKIKHSRPYSHHIHCVSLAIREQGESEITHGNE